MLNLLPLVILCVAQDLTAAITTHESILLPQSYPQNHDNQKTSYYINFLRKYNSLNPVVILIEDKKQSHEEANQFLENIHKIEPKVDNINFLLMKFNVSGATPVLETSQNNKNRLRELIGTNVEKDTNFLGWETGAKSAIFFGILNAVQALPANGGIAVFSKSAIEDEELAQHALSQAGKKRVQVFVFWGGRTDEKLLREFALSSGGDFYPTSTAKDLSQVYYEDFLENIDKFSDVSTILSKKGLQFDSNLQFPVDSSVSAIHITITPNITNGILRAPQGHEINVLRSEEVARYSTGSFVHRDGGVDEIHLNIETQGVGSWSLSVSNAHTYDITIFAHTKLTTEALVTFHNQTDTGKVTARKKVIRLGVAGDISSISSISFVNSDGRPVLDNADIGLEKYHAENIDVETNAKKDLDVEVNKLPEEPFYAVINGKDWKGNNFTRLSYITRNPSQPLPLLTIEVGLGSDLITQPNRQAQIYFEVANNGNSPTLVRFRCQDDKSILWSMYPWQTWITPGETATVQVLLRPRQGYYTDVLTFTATGSERATKKVIVDVGSSLQQDDSRDPELSYRFTSDCIGIFSCEEGIWNVEVRAKDIGSGLLKIESRPRGLYFPNSFTTGTTEEVTGYYSDTCCRPDLELIAIDRQNNRRVKKINAYWANLGPGAIAAIVLGILIFIALIVLIVWVCRTKVECCKKKGKFEIPTYRGPHGKY